MTATCKLLNNIHKELITSKLSENIGLHAVTSGVVLFLAYYDRIILQKNELSPRVIEILEYLIEVFRKTLRIYPQCRLVVASDGAYSIYLKVTKSINAKITYTGYLDKTKSYELYPIADIGVMLSFQEQCSYATIEMMMYSIPLIASTTTGLKEMVEDGIGGLHIPVIGYLDKVEIDIDLLVQKMLYLSENPVEAKRLGKNARKRYSGEVFRKNMLNFYYSLYEWPV